MRSAEHEMRRQLELKALNVFVALVGTWENISRSQCCQCCSCLFSVIIFNFLEFFVSQAQRELRWRAEHRELQLKAEMTEMRHWNSDFSDHWAFPLSGRSFFFCVCSTFRYTLLGTNISHQNSLLKMIFLFPRWDMLVPPRVYFFLKLRRMKNSWQAHWEGNSGFLEFVTSFNGFGQRKRTYEVEKPAPWRRREMI